MLTTNKYSITEVPTGQGRSLSFQIPIYFAMKATIGVTRSSVSTSFYNGLKKQ